MSAVRSTVSELLEAWFAIAATAWAPTTIRQTRSVLDRYLHPHPGHLAVGDVTPIMIDAVGPRGDGCVVDSARSVPEATAFHGPQARAFVEAGADMMSAITMTYVEEAVDITNAAVDVDLPVAVSFTVETDCRLPSGQPMSDAIRHVDDITSGAPAYYLVNCATSTNCSS